MGGGSLRQRFLSLLNRTPLKFLMKGMTLLPGRKKPCMHSQIKFYLQFQEDLEPLHRGQVRIFAFRKTLL